MNKSNIEQYVPPYSVTSKKYYWIGLRRLDWIDINERRKRPIDFKSIIICIHTSRPSSSGKLFSCQFVVMYWSFEGNVHANELIQKQITRPMVY